jgi:hypothetical protein
MTQEQSRDDRPLYSINDRRAAALAGLGVLHEDRFEATSLNRTPPNHDRIAGLNVPQDEPDPRLTRRGVTVCGGQPFEIEPFAFDMLARAASVSDGNAFFPRGYDPAVYDDPKGDHEMIDFGTQYLPEAAHAAQALDGLNIPPADLVTAVLSTASASRLEPGAHAPTEADSIQALVRLTLRLLADTTDERAAKRRIAAFRAAFNAQLLYAGLD